MNFDTQGSYFIKVNLFSFLGEGSFSTVYLAESKAQKGGWVAIKVVEKIDLLKTKKIVNPTNPDSETESINENHIPISSKNAEEDDVIQGMEFQGHKLM